MARFEPKIVIFSAPSGSGKTTIVQHLLRVMPNLGFSISACTRPRRTHEQDGKDYYFLSPDAFRIHIAQDDFIEYEEVYPDRYYGTLKSEITRLAAQRKHVIFDVDVVGGLNLKKYFAARALSVFVSVPSLADLEDRLRARQTESEAALRARIEKFAYELSFQDQFDKVLVNAHLPNTLQAAESLVGDFLSKA